MKPLKILYYGIPISPEILRSCLAHSGIRVTKLHAARLFALYRWHIKAPRQWTDGGGQTPEWTKIRAYKRKSLKLLRRDTQILVRAKLIYPLIRPANCNDVIWHFSRNSRLIMSLLRNR